jgi:hypothetical protein
MNAHDVAARAKQVLTRWDRQRAEIERDMQKGSAA